MTQNILLVEFKNNNLGDNVISETCEYIIKQIDPSINITKMDLFPPKEMLDKFEDFIPFKHYEKILPILQRLNVSQEYIDFKKWTFFAKKNTEVYNKYDDCIKKADKVIFAGGALIKYLNDDFWNVLYSIIQICDKYKIPVYINAAGVEGYDRKNYRCQVLKTILSKKIVTVSTRDDLKTLKRYLSRCKEKQAVSQRVGDPALYSSETYNIKANKNSEIIGVGVIRGDIFVDYGYDFSEEDVIKTYVKIIKSLEKNNYKWQMFCNGTHRDYRLAKKVLKKLKLPNEEKYLTKRPITTEDLVLIISQYKAIIAARLHANIIATSLGIPSVGLVWNEKLIHFGKIIGSLNRFIRIKNFVKEKYVIKQLEEAIENKYDESIINDLKAYTYRLLYEFIKK